MSKKKTVTLIAPPKLQACDEAIAVLETMLAKAKSGELDGLMMVISYPAQNGERGTFGTVFVENQERNMVGFLGMIEVLKARMMHRVVIPERDEGEEDE